MLRVEKIIPTDPRLPLSVPELQKIFTGLASLWGLENWAVDLRVVDDLEIAALNEQFMGCLGPTNILSFPSGESPWLGDLVLSAPTLAREIRLYNQDSHAYTIRLLAHGLLHLLGYEHGPDMDVLTDLAEKSLNPEIADFYLFSTL